MHGRARMAVLTLVLALLVPGVARPAETDNSPLIVVSIRPLYSLVAQLTDGITTPVLLLAQSQSPHHYSLRPSQRRQLAQADIIIRIGPILESFLDKVVEQQSALLIDVWQAPGLALLPKRGRQKHAHQKNAPPENPALTQTDPHIWLSAANAAAISRYISRQLIASDPARADGYEKNLRRLLAAINRADRTIRSRLTNTERPFISFHDAFQYFEKAYGLNHVSSITLDEESGSSLRHLREVAAAIRAQNIHCLVYQAPRPALVGSLQQNTGITAVALDPLGIDSSNDREAWFEIMQQLGSGFARCLAAGQPQ